MEEVSSIAGCFSTKVRHLLNLHVATGKQRYVLRLRQCFKHDQHIMVEEGRLLIECSLDEMSTYFGWERGNLSDMNSANERFKWTDLMGYTGYESSRTSARMLKDPTIFYIHFALTRTLFAKNSGRDKVSKNDLAVLHMISEGRKVHWAYYFCKHLKHIRVVAPVCIGGMVTHFLRSRHPLPVPADHTILDLAFIDFHKLNQGGHLIETWDGRFIWNYHKDPARRPVITPPRRGRPRTKPREEPGAMIIAETGESSRQRAGQGLEQTQIDLAFNAMRQICLGVTNVVPVPAPPGWRPGHAIPDEYLQPPPPGHL